MPSDKLGCHVKDRTLSMMEVHPRLVRLHRERKERADQLLLIAKLRAIAAKKTKAK